MRGVWLASHIAASSPQQFQLAKFFFACSCVSAIASWPSNTKDKTGRMYVTVGSVAMQEYIILHCSKTVLKCCDTTQYHMEVGRPPAV
jgi:hypothetical protein